MDHGPAWIVRRDFPPSGDGYDRAAVDAHLEAVAAAVAREDGGLSSPAADRELLAAGRVLLAQISSLRVELKNLSASLREQGVTISDVLDELLDLDEAPPPASAADAPEPRRPAPAGTLEDARLVALDMALGGSSREEIDRELAGRFDLPDARALVDEVLAAIG